MFYSVLLIIHIVSGSAALIGGLAAIVARKSKGLHSRAGTVYYISMYVVGATAITMTLIRFNPFLLAIGLFAVYLTYTGRKAITMFRATEPWKPQFSQLLPSYLALAVSVFMIGWPMVRMFMEGHFFVPILGVFGLILFLNAWQDVKALREVSNLFPRNRMFLLMHIGKMSGAYIATVTAFLVNNVSTNPAWIAWLLPTLIGSPLIARSIRIWKQKLRLA